MKNKLMYNKLMYNVFFILTGFLFNKCGPCPERPVYSVQEVKDWICYKEGQILKFIDSTGNRREYKVNQLKTSQYEVFPSSQHLPAGIEYFRHCPEYIYINEGLNCTITNTKDTLDRIYWFLANTRGSTSLGLRTDSLISDDDIGPKEYDLKEKTFTNGEQISPTVFYFSNVTIQNKFFTNVYKVMLKNNDSSLYYLYNKNAGIIKFKFSKKSPAFELTD